MSSELCGLSRCVAFVKQGYLSDITQYGETLTGPVLCVEGPLKEELDMAGWDLADQYFPPPSSPGLQVFEGWVEVGPGPDPDVLVHGEWRPLTHWEMCRMRHGLSPWKEEINGQEETTHQDQEEATPREA